MAEYIERDAIAKLFDSECCGECVVCPHDDCGDCTLINQIPTADVQPVKHGRWIQDEHTYSGCWTYNYICSACGEIGGSWLRNIRRDQMFPYCPFCGAKMDGEA